MYLVDSKRRRVMAAIAHLCVAGVSRRTADSAMVVTAGKCVTARRKGESSIRDCELLAA